MLDLEKFNLSLQYVVNPSGERVAVIVPIEEFEELLEDLEDLAAAAERRDEPTIAHQEVLDGLGL
jgi:PHD/YefM family antitoxin component YafN of YafNO toxin-antitoxin module